MGNSKEHAGVKDVDIMVGLGPIGILRETFKLLWTHGKLFMLITLTLVLPSEALGVALQFIISHFDNVKVTFTSPPVSGHGVSSHGAVKNNALELLFLPGADNQYHVHALAPVLRHLALNIGVLLVTLGAQATCMISIVYPVGLIYTGRSVSFSDAVHALPRLLKRVFLTNICFVVLLCSMVGVVCALSVFLIVAFSLGPGWLGLMVLVLVLLIVYVILFVGLARRVAVFEESYGWAALRRGFKLLQGKTWVAIGLTSLLLLPGMCFAYFIATPTEDRYSKDPWSLTFLLFFVLYIVARTLLDTLGALCGAVLYISCKAYHGESLAESRFFKEVTKEGYEHIEVGEIDPEFAGSFSKKLHPDDGLV